MALGIKLSAHLEKTDTLGRWMAHHLADRIVNLEQITGSDRVRAENEITDLIFRFWSIRRNFPGDAYPLVEIDDVESAIARLAPGRRAWSYYNIFEPNFEPASEELDTNTTLNAALHIDRIAGNLVNSLIGYAATVATTKNATWVEHLENIGDTSFQRIKEFFLSNSSDKYTDYNDKRIQEIQRYLTEISSIVLQLQSLFTDSTEN